MHQLVQLMDVHGEFEKRDTRIVGLANEEQSLENFAKVDQRFDGGAPFDLVVDLAYHREGTGPYERTTAYLIDKKGVVRQVFPMEIYERPPWWAFLHEIDRVLR